MSTPPTTPTPPGGTPSKSRWNRMGGVIRRASTVLTIANNATSRPGTPSQERDSDSASLKRSTSRPDGTPPSTSTSPQPQAQEPQPRRQSFTRRLGSRSNSVSSVVLSSDVASIKGIPSPIAESPAREEQAEREQVVGPSPLGREPSTTDAAPVPATVSAALPEDVSLPTSQPIVEPKLEESHYQDIATSPTGYVPPPVIDSTAGNPGAFTDDPETLPQPIVLQDPYAAPVEPEVTVNRNEVPVEPKGEESKVEETRDAPREEPNAEEVQEAVKPVEEPAPAAPEPQFIGEPEPLEESKPEIITMEPPSYFEKPIVESVKDIEAVEAKPAVVEPNPPSPTDYVPPPVIDSTAGNPGAFSDDLEAPPRPAVRDQAPVTEVHEVTVHEQPVVTVPAAATEEPQAHTQVESEVHPQPQAGEALVEGEAASYYRGDVQGMPIAEPHVHEQSDFSIHDIGQREQDIWGGAIVDSNGHMEHKGQKEEDEEKKSHNGILPMPIPVHHEETADETSNVSMPNPHSDLDADEDPFADPVIPITSVRPQISEPHPSMPEPSHTQVQGDIVVMPLPALHEVIPSHSNHSVLSVVGKRHADEPNEQSPLLGSNKQNGNGNGYSSIPSHRFPAPPLNVFTNTSASPWNNVQNGSHHQHEPKLHEYGWLEYRLPDGGVYYVHPTRRLTTDVDLRLERVLLNVEKWVEEREGLGEGFDGDGHGGLTGGRSVNVGIEGWLKEVKPVKKTKPAKGQIHPSMVFERFWVDHLARSVLSDDQKKTGNGYVGRGLGYNSSNSSKGKATVSHTHSSSKKNGVPEEDQLDLEYRYWSFMEAYPAHTPLPARARDDALDVLTWAWTDGLLPSHRSVPAPFTKAECQELLSLLKSFQRDTHRGHIPEDHGIETRVVARILLRVAQWRQTYFRPSKPLPQDVSHSRVPAPFTQRPRRTFRGVLLEVVVSCLFLGIPYLFYERHNARLNYLVTSGGAGRFNLGLSGLDPEFGFPAIGSSGSGSSLVVVGACTCLVAAILLSGSVTFLNLPGLDGFARTASVVATLFAAASIAATALVVLRAKANTGSEWNERLGFGSSSASSGILNTSTLTQSLPLVFLVYGLIAFMASIVLFVFRGQGAGGGGKVFDDFTRLTVITVGGAIAGVVAMFWIVVLKSK